MGLVRGLIWFNRGFFSNNANDSYYMFKTFYNHGEYNLVSCKKWLSFMMGTMMIQVVMNSAFMIISWLMVDGSINGRLLDKRPSEMRR